MLLCTTSFYSNEEISIKEKMICGAIPMSYDDVLKMDLSQDTTILGFADDEMVCTAEDKEILDSRVNEVIAGVKNWLERRSLKIANIKTEALAINNK